MLGDADKVEFVPLKASLRFPALEARRVDLLARYTTWTLTRVPVLGVQFPAAISKEPLAPAIWGGDPRWASVVRWVLFALILAEEDGITRANVDAKVAAREGLMAWISMDEYKLVGQAMGLTPGWGARAIQAVGNYGEVFERNLGAGGLLHIDLGLNRLWTQGG
jgi:general L-amino acid transport system substrate-binding protein